MSILIIPKQVCSDCGSNETYRNRWYNSESFENPDKSVNDTGFICNKCYQSRKYHAVKRLRSKVHMLCLWCGGDFKKNSGNSKFCNKICQRKYIILGK